MTLGPLEYTVFGFDGNRFDGSIVNKTIRVVDSQGVLTDEEYAAAKAEALGI